MKQKNIRLFIKKVFLISFVLVFAVSSVFIFDGLNKGKNPKTILIEKVLDAPVKQSFKILSGNYDLALMELQSSGIDTKNAKTIKELAQNNKTSPFKIISLISE